MLGKRFNSEKITDNKKAKIDLNGSDNDNDEPVPPAPVSPPTVGTPVTVSASPLSASPLSMTRRYGALTTLLKKRGPTTPTPRSVIVRQRTYQRSTEDADGTLRQESWTDVVDRCIAHQKWLWARAQADPSDRARFKGMSRAAVDAIQLPADQTAELEMLRQLVVEGYASFSGRTLFLGGTPVSRTSESSMFNCSFVVAETRYDIVDIFWLLLNGCGVGFRPRIGTLHGFPAQIPETEVVRSKRDRIGGNPRTLETFEHGDDGKVTWRIILGDSAEAWAKSVGKLLALERRVDKVIIDFGQIRPAGTILRRYGWRCSGDAAIAAAYPKIIQILNNRVDALLTEIDILDIVNLLGTVLSSRRSAQICLQPYGGDHWETFATAKKDHWKHHPHRSQSNNSLIFRKKPSQEELEHVFALIADGGGSEPGFVNGESAQRRAPFFQGLNPCAEILLGNKSFCNLVEINLVAFVYDGVLQEQALHECITLLARANYRQTCVDLNDGILQESWHKNNHFLRLCGVGLTGITAVEHLLPPTALTRLKQTAIGAANAQATALELPLPKNVCTVKPSGSISKIMGRVEWGEIPEGVHQPYGRYIFNNIQFGAHDPLVASLRDAGYHVFDNPYEGHLPAADRGKIIRIPVEYKTGKFRRVAGVGRLHDDGTHHKDSLEYNEESALHQLERYRRVNSSYVGSAYEGHNTSITVSYSSEEVPAMITWLRAHWDEYIAVSFLLRQDPSKTAKDLGYPYLPQELASEEAFRAYVAALKPLAAVVVDSTEQLLEAECAGGACPTR